MKFIGHGSLIVLLIALTGCQSELPERAEMTQSKSAVSPDLPGTPMKLVPQTPPQSDHDGVRVSIALPRDAVHQPAQLQLLDNQGEVMSVQRHIRLHWPTTASGSHGIRVIELHIPGSPEQLMQQDFYLRLTDTAMPMPEPVISRALGTVAMLPAQWHIGAMLFGRGLPLDNPHWFDQAMLAFTYTATNRLPDSVNAAERIRLDDPEAWLFDRAGTLFQLYFRSGVPWHFAEAEQASRIYANSLDRQGWFSGKPGDLKYVYPRSLLYRWMLFGEDHQRGHIERMAQLASSWTSDGRSARFWTERHANYALAAAVHAWELTGSKQHQQRIDALIDDLLAMSGGEENSRTYHCPAHRMEAHEGKKSDQMVCSPWMLALLGQTLDYYYQLSDDPRAATLLAQLHRFLLRDGLYRVPADSADVKLRGMLLPWYLAGPGYGFSDNGPFGDLEHACDVAGLLARSGDARKRTEQLPADHGKALQGLMQSCEFNLNMWHRPGSDTQHGKPVWRLSPARKYNWWFGSTQELTWWLSAPR